MTWIELDLWWALIHLREDMWKQPGNEFTRLYTDKAEYRIYCICESLNYQMAHFISCSNQVELERLIEQFPKEPILGDSCRN